MSSAPPTTQPVSHRKKSSRKAWLAVLVIVAALAIAIAVAWERILAAIRSARPEMLLLVAVAVWAGTALIMYLWRVSSLHRARKRARRAEAQLVDRFQRQAQGAVTEAIELAAVTTEWAVRAELVRDDLEDVQEYMQHLAKRPRIRRAFVAKPDGTVIGAGDRRERGKSLAALVPNLPAEASTLQKVPLDNGGQLFVVPVMGLESRLGTLVIEHEPPVFLAEAG